MVKRLRLTPVLYAALGAAAGFYWRNLKFTVVLFVLITVLCLFRVLASLAAQRRCGEYRPLQLTSVCSAAFTVGLCLGVCAASAGRNDVYFGIPHEKVIALNGVLMEDPRIISGGRITAVLSMRQCAGAGGVRVKSRGEIPVFFPEESAEMLQGFGRGTTVFTEGRLRETSTGWIYSAESLHIVKPAKPMERVRTGIRLSLIKRFTGNWGGLALALLLGIRDNLDSNLAAMYRAAGCSYILALSGMHLAVLASLIAFLLKKPLGLKAASVAGALIIILYCFIVGPMPSLNRAALMYLLGVLAVLGAFPKEPLSLLALSFLLQIVISPGSGNSISFILSYLALAGILVVGRPLYSLLSGKVPDFLAQPLSASCGAFAATAGITAFSFGALAPVGIVAGLALVPLTTVFMIGSLAWLVLDFFSFSFFLNTPLSLLYQLMEKTVSFAGRAPGISASRPAVILALSLVLPLLVAILEYRRRTASFTLHPFG